MCDLLLTSISNVSKTPTALEISISSQLDLTCPIKFEEFAFLLSKTEDSVNFAVEYFLDKQSIVSYENEQNDFTDLTEIVETALFRGQMILDIEKEKSHNTFRIFALGGSTTFGIGAEDDETWPVYLQQIMNEKNTGKIIKTQKSMFTEMLEILSEY